jgi:ATP-dependent RNA helicase RhlB
MSEEQFSDTRFDSLPLAAPIMQGIAEAGFIHCTPIQAQTIPVALAGRDLAGQAQTGTGKTAAFLIGAFQYLLEHPAGAQRRPDQPRTIILAPTRELAVQIHKDAELIGRYTDFRLALVYGGAGYESQRNALREGVDILIGTPGRLIDYYKQKVFDLQEIQVVILDEADRMFDLGFIKDIRYLLRRMPAREARLGMLFSATLSFRVNELAYEHMNNPEAIKIESENITADKVRQLAYMVANEEKIPLLIGLLRQMEPARSIVFVNTKRECDRVWGYLEGNGISAAVLSGDVPQKKRLRLLSQFQAGELPVLVATDVAARGLHIPDVSHVFNYDLPEDAEDYVHRIGRTARAGASGDAVSFVCETYAFSLPDIETFIDDKIAIEPVTTGLLAEIDPNSRIRPPRPARDSRSRRGGPKGNGRRPPGRSGSGERRAQQPQGSKEGEGRAKGGEEGSGNKPKRRRSRKRPPSSPKNENS